MVAALQENGTTENDDGGDLITVQTYECAQGTTVRVSAAVRKIKLLELVPIFEDLGECSVESSRLVHSILPGCKPLPQQGLNPLVQRGKGLNVG